ncbi:hypothetical protein AMTRI_Chr12g240810 [Amborella trichopoda]|uniref:CONSTANS-like protein n=1 Tax=Amborella trichopoda TaxID=13333 RepID=W1PI08_AMBTC|nr:zinc finger protein CONSTANS-LIKE 4 [Amborella trichopoda]ERN07246.1 hypothetical protein AMTR_s00019p00192190 [Amborella trichopoda]|eukprot:XP_006845571.1 zinc finger protein CONSTANS-LIKE 4 [Amborella trichopoda]
MSTANVSATTKPDSEPRGSGDAFSAPFAAQFPGHEAPPSAPWSVAKACEGCKATAALLFCRADSAFLCLGCDARVHGANKLASRHERVWVCEVCEQAPASVTCKADAAALCVACDADIHSANPLARRHERFPVVPFYEPPAPKSSASCLLVPDRGPKTTENAKLDDEDEDDDHNSIGADEAEAATWLLPNPKIGGGEMKSADYFFPEVDPYLDLEYGSPVDQRFQAHNGTDSVVPVQSKGMGNDQCLEFDFSRPKNGYSYTTASMSHSVSSSSLDVGVVPDGSAMTDISNPYSRTLKGGQDLVAHVPSQPSSHYPPMDREARVLRYREKRKNRKFEKTIRYASRKAYAETRPRIKGRFAKRTDIEVEVDRIYSSAAALMADTSYGIVPSF